MSGSNRSNDRSRPPARWRGIGWARALPLAACIVTVGSTTGGCSKPPAKPVDGLELVVSTEGLNVPQDFDDIKLEVSDQADGGGWNKLWDNDYVLPSQQVTLPATFTLFAGQSPDEVLIVVTAYQHGPGGTPVVQRVAQVQVPTDRMAVLYLVLAALCEGQVAEAGDGGEPMSMCASGESCQPSTGMCGSNIIPPSALPTYMPGQSLDAGPDSGSGTVSTSAGTGSSANGSSASSSSGPGVTSTATSTGSSTNGSGPSDTGTSTSTGAGTSTGTGADAGPSGTGTSTGTGTGCTDACTAGLTECASGGVQTCQTPTGGCTQWVTTATCGSNQMCAVTGGSAACICNSTVCAAAGSICQDAQTVATCAKDTNGCLYVASTATCTSPESCAAGDGGLGAACSLTCSSSCTKGEASCVSGDLATCTQGTNGCWALGTPVACGAHQSCTGNAGTAACTCNASTVCTETGTACDGNGTVATCDKDANGCFYAASTQPCASPESCVGNAPNAKCALTCTSTCTPGQTLCVTGGLETCTLGTNGCWAYGPAVACGAHQSCTGPSGSGMCTCNVSATCAAVGKVCATTSTLATCAQDAQGCFYESGSTPCTNGACSVGACCTNACTITAGQCVTGGLETCATQSSGCTAWGSPVACPAATPYCSAGACTATPPSCQVSAPGTTNCGAASESCCTSLEVPGGMYDRTYTNTGTGPTDVADPATVSGLRMDKYLVTVGRFRQYVNYVTGSAGVPPANGSGIHTHLNGGLGLANSGSPGTYETGWDASDWNTYIATGAGAASTWNTNLACDPNYATWTTTAASQENLPINCVSWYASYAFCIWDGGFLPSEAEWEYVAAGGSQELEYPWGSTDPGPLNQYAIYFCDYGACTDALNSIAPVGTATLGAGYWGQLDMAGEVLEWNLDWYATYVDPCTNCAYLTGTAERVVRGGSFDAMTGNLHPAARNNSVGLSTPFYVGFRCSRAP
jgi:formylglycine-generating enzyme required for sulfatase activity